MFKYNKTGGKLGVELELEGFWNGHSIRNISKKLCDKYILEQSIDSSVADDATEIKFKYFPLKQWKPPEITQICSNLGKFGLYPGKTASMHIHYSSKYIDKLWDIHKRESEYMDKNKKNNFLSNLFITIGAREGLFNGAYICGIDYDWAEADVKDGKTLEIRTFASTLNPLIFYSRLCVTQYILDFIVTKKYEDLPNILLESMPRSIKNQMALLLTTQNPNKFGFSKDFVLKKLSR